MCGRFGSFVPAEDLAEHFELDEEPEHRPRYNIAPTQIVAVVRPAYKSARRELTYMNWGLIPSWAKDVGVGARLINARAESAAQKPAFRSAMKRRRALIPADGFYEWSRRDKEKRPWWFRIGGGGPFAFAGLWEHWHGRDGDEIESCAILTTAANDLVAGVHERMPVILRPEDYGLWLGPGDEDPAVRLPLLKPYPAEKMEAWPVGAYVNSIRNEGPKCIEPAAETQLDLLP